MPNLFTAAAQAVRRAFGTVSDSGQLSDGGQQPLAQSVSLHPNRTLSPAAVYSILKRAIDGDLAAQSDLFKELEQQDGHIFAEMSKRKRAVSALPWSVEPPENPTAAEKYHAELVQSWLKATPEWSDFITSLLEAVGHGFSCLELKWVYDGTFTLPRKWKFVEHRYFLYPRTDLSGQRIRDPQLRLYDGTTQGAELWRNGWLIHRHAALSGDFGETGLFRVLIWPFLFANFATRDWMEFLDTYGLPILLGKFPDNSDKAVKNALLAAVLGIRRNAGGVLPTTQSIEALKGTEGKSDEFQKMIDWCEKTVSKVVLGATLTSSEGSHGTQALGNVHNDVRLDIMMSDATQLSETLTQYAQMLLSVNIPNFNPLRSPKIVFDTRRPEDIKVYSEALPKLVECGMQIPQQWAHHKLAIPVPKAGEPVLQMVRKPDAVPASTAALAEDPKPATVYRFDDQVALDKAIDSIAPEDLQAQAMAMLEPIMQVLTKADDIPQALAMLAELAPDQAPDMLQQRLERLLFAAQAWGAINAQEELANG